LLFIEGDPTKFEDATFSRSAGKIGQRITHVGNVKGPNFDTSFEAGVLSQHGVTIAEEDCLLDQGSFAIAPGCSGGPVFDTSGNVIGLGVVYIGPGVSLYVPVRELEPAAEAAGIDWALHGFYHPPARELSELIQAREKAVENTVPDFLQLLFGAPPEKK
jgi:S1-C subfamily serine protease